MVVIVKLLEVIPFITIMFFVGLGIGIILGRQDGKKFRGLF